MSDFPRIPLSVLDLAPVTTGASASQGLADTLVAARRADELGYTRFWVAEHHNMPGVASSSPAVLIGALAGATERIRVGSGGVMLPNHAPLVIAEQFGTLAALHGDRIDLGIGRAPGTDPATAAALRRSVEGLSGEDFPQALMELFGWLGDGFPAGHPYARITAVPAGDARVPVWLLGSSGYSAQVAGMLGLPFAFAHHFSSASTEPALELYRQRFTPSQVLTEPWAMVAVATVVGEGAGDGDGDADAQRLALPSALSFLRLRQGHPGTLPTQAEAEAYPWTADERAFVAQRWEGQAVGSIDTVRQQLAQLVARTGVQELMVTTQAPTIEARLRTLETVAGFVGTDLPLGMDARGVAA